MEEKTFIALGDVNPFIRFAERIRHRSAGRVLRGADCRLFYITGGSGCIRIGGQTYALREDTVFYCCAGSVYSIVSEGLSLISLNFDLDRSHTDVTDSLSPVPADETDASLPAAEDTAETFLGSHICIENGRTYLSAIEEILSEFTLRTIYYQQKSGGILKTLLTEIARAQILHESDAAHTVSRILEYIEGHLSEPLGNRELAEAAGYHAYHLNRLFVRRTGQSLHRYVLTRKLNEAKRLLLSTGLSVAEIAERCGFGSAAHFSASFKRRHGLSPLQYRIKCKTFI